MKIMKKKEKEKEEKKFQANVEEEKSKSQLMPKQKHCGLEEGNVSKFVSQTDLHSSAAPTNQKNEKNQKPRLPLNWDVFGAHTYYAY